MKKLTFSQKEIAEKSYAVVLFRGYAAEDDQLLYAYLYARFDKLIELKKAIRLKKDLVMQNYGKVLAWGYGAPTVEVMTKMRDDYGFDHDSGLTMGDGPSAAERDEVNNADKDES